MNKECIKLFMQDEKTCYFCGTSRGIHLHHVFGGTANRKVCDRVGLCVWLCGEHHNLSSNSVHMNREMDLLLKRKAQEYYEENIGSRDEFRKLFGKSWL